MKYIDLVVCGPDMSGTGTQVKDLIDYFQSTGKKVRDMRGTEIDALFHAEIFSKYNQTHLSLQEFLNDNNVPLKDKKDFTFQANNLMFGSNTNEDLKVASFVKNEVSTYIDPENADVWIFEEPTKRGAGQVNRAIEQNRTKYGSNLDPLAAAYNHQVYRIDEFLRFRKVLREHDKIIIRSRSEESGVYQVRDEKSLQNGINMDIFLALPGHKIAFGNPPTHIFIVCAKPDWTKEGYIKMREERRKNRLIDDHEAMIDYQLLVNRRYSTNWIEEFYKKGCNMNNAEVPEFTRFDIHDSKEEIKEKMVKKLKEILNNES